MLQILSTSIKLDELLHHCRAISDFVSSFNSNIGTTQNVSQALNSIAAYFHVRILCCLYSVVTEQQRVPTKPVRARSNHIQRHAPTESKPTIKNTSKTLHSDIYINQQNKPQQVKYVCLYNSHFNMFSVRQVSSSGTLHIPREPCT